MKTTKEKKERTTFSKEIMNAFNIPLYAIKKKIFCTEKELLSMDYRKVKCDGYTFLIALSSHEAVQSIKGYTDTVTSIRKFGEKSKPVFGQDNRVGFDLLVATL